MNFGPPAWRINNNFANFGREFLTCRPQALSNDKRRIYINYGNIGGEFLT